MRFYGSFTKVDAEQRIVEGYASTEARDGHGEIVLKSAIEDALVAYLEYGNIREMHQLSAVGTAEDATIDDKGLYLSAKVVDDVAWSKVISGVYKGFSIGGKILARDPDEKRIITKIRLDEISLVDRPSNPESKFDLWRATGASDDAISRATAALTAADAALACVGAPSPNDPVNFIQKALAARDAEIERLQKRIAEIEAQPTPRKTAAGFFAVSKEHDAGGSGALNKSAPEVDDVVKLLDAMTPDDRALLLIKAAQRRPFLVVDR